MVVSGCWWREQRWRYIPRLGTQRPSLTASFFCVGRYCSLLCSASRCWCQSRVEAEIEIADRSSDTDEISEIDISKEECKSSAAFIRAPRGTNLSSAGLSSAFRTQQEQEQRWLKLAVDEFNNLKTTYRRLRFAAEVQDLYSDAWFGGPVPSAAVATQQQLDKRKTSSVFSSLKQTLKSVRSVLMWGWLLHLGCCSLIWKRGRKKRERNHIKFWTRLVALPLGSFHWIYYCFKTHFTHIVIGWRL
jgi:hypothetical protein